MEPTLYTIDEAYQATAKTDWYWLVTDAEDPRGALDQIGEKSGALFSLMRQIGQNPQGSISEQKYRRLRKGGSAPWDRGIWQLWELKIKQKGAADVRFYVFRNSNAFVHPIYGDVAAFGMHIVVQACDKEPNRKKAEADYGRAQKRIEEWNQ